jgi:hypothetical protein
LHSTHSPAVLIRPSQTIYERLRKRFYFTTVC